ncbi:hypothetical protein BABINDRAFT_161509 [Babjeviella inositovora NRRL Y-12698]|uniref:GYF domain-containing protein n=1 Tax=Babjeviella inositovora NRRL Y-12698 TaxID=984486 RepID=A0A1E3QS16_9ASCO|nr:uncharacterized protein BABINDRAFT_161509 [Babjeviella inositovora NRRL Y-12698]ODQ79822.1 hypothetical protein BABINDRAFT_161509 [Babjeviella inositovora NRRL Y-12698]
MPTTNSNFTSHWMRSNETSRADAVAQNVAGRRYAMDEMFDVWHMLQVRGLRTHAGLENYKVQTPAPILHLELQEANVLDRRYEFQPEDPLGDLTSLLQQLQSETWVPATATTGVPAASPFLSRASSFMHTGTPPPSAPPGIALAPAATPTATTLLAPLQINWIYLDPSGLEQGPFDGTQMHTWYTANYLAPDLRIRRVEETMYQPLSEFVRALGVYDTPFLTPLPQPQVLSSNYFGQDFGLNYYQGMDMYGYQWKSPVQAVQTVQAVQPVQPVQPMSPWMSRTTSTTDFSLRSQSPFAPQIGFLMPKSEVLEASAQVTTPIQENGQANGQVAVPSPTKASSAAPSPEQKPKEEKKVFKETTPEVEASVEVAPEVSTEILAAAPTSVAPWASASTKDAAPKLNLKEIQAIEAKKLQESLRLQEQAREQQRLLLASRILAEGVELESRPTLPATASWASTSSALTQTPKKTLAEIQKEEAEAARVKQVKPVAKPDASFSAFAAAAVPADGAWTVVGKKPKAVPATTAIPAAKPVAVAAAAPRVVAAAAAPTTVAISTPREEFLSWARTNIIGLNSGVNKEEVLNMLLMLPAGAESSEIIADTIYYNSSTMDGRRFASEFLKRRRAVEQTSASASDGSWSDALRSTKVVTEDNDGWGAAFKVVSKKKGKRVV